MRHVLSILFVAAILTAPVLADHTTVAHSVRPLQAAQYDEYELQTFRNICTVTSINATEHYWLTAAHCVSDPELFISSRHAEIVFADTDADLAVLYTEGYALPAVELRSTPPTVSDHIMMVGHPVGLHQVQVFNGRISSLLTDVDTRGYTMFDMTACGGNSGSVVVDADDRVVSVLQIGSGPGCSPFSGGAPWDVVVRLVGKYFKQ